MAYTTKAKIENFIQTDIDDTIAGYVTDWINWVTEYIDNYTKTSFEGTTEARYFDTNGENSILIDDLISATQIDFLDQDGNVDETLATADYWFYPLNKTPKYELRLNPYESHSTFPVGSKRLKITGTWGYSSSVPSDIEWVATRMVGDIIRQHSDVAKDINSENLGEYSVNFASLTARPEYQKILDHYRVPTI